ncbi:MAG: aminofutalosine synthase MqnE, partial [Marinilabiliales bacterium]
MSDLHKGIAIKIFNQERLNIQEGIELFNFELGILGVLSSYLNNIKNQDKVFFNKNFHIEPTNICIYDCTFCSYHRKINQEGSWEYSMEDILKKAESYKDTDVTEVHIVGGVHPNRDLHYYGE